jgi:hypothetical protein
MLHRSEDMGPREANFYALLRERGKIVPGSRREVHNVFTNEGRDWMSKLVAWHSFGDPDDPVTNRRVRWMGVGTGTTQTEDVSVDSLETPALVAGSDYLAIVQASEFPEANTVRFVKEFGPTEISTESNPSVPMTEAGLFVDVYKATRPSDPTPGIGGYEDSPYAGLLTTLNPALGTNAPVAYARFEPITKTSDFVFEVRWDFKF